MGLTHAVLGGQDHVHVFQFLDLHADKFHGGVLEEPLALHSLFFIFITFAGGTALFLAFVTILLLIFLAVP